MVPNTEIGTSQIQIPEAVFNYMNDEARRERIDIKTLLDRMAQAYKKHAEKLHQGEKIFNEMLDAVQEAFPTANFEQSRFTFENGELVAVIDVPATYHASLEARARKMAESVEKSYHIRCKVILFYRGRDREELNTMLKSLGVNPEDLHETHGWEHLKARVK